MMTDPDRGTDRAGRRARRFLTLLQKYEIFLQLVRQEVTLAEAAENWQVDRSTIMRIRTVAKAPDGEDDDPRPDDDRLRFEVVAEGAVGGSRRRRAWGAGAA